MRFGSSCGRDANGRPSRKRGLGRAAVWCMSGSKRGGSRVSSAILTEMVLFYAEQQDIGWEWQSIDSKSCPAPLGGQQTGKNPTDRGKRGTKIHILVDEHGAPLAIHATG